MSNLDALILGLIQGLTEFLPVSSSGHLVLGRELLGVPPGGGAHFEVMLHLASLFSIATLFFRDFVALLAEVPRLFSPRSWRADYAARPWFRLAVLILVSLVPVVIAGLLLKDPIESLFAKPRLVAAFILVTAAVLLATLFARQGAGEVGLRAAVLMGIAQMCALLPGISRSGSTISTGMMAGVDRAAAGRFSFLMVAPAILGAVILESFDRDPVEPVPLSALAVGMGAAYVSGLLALFLLLRFLRQGRLWPFALWCIAAGSFALLSGRL